MILADSGVLLAGVCTGNLLNPACMSTYCCVGEDKSIIFMIERMDLPCASSDSWFSEFTSLLVYSYCSHFSRKDSRFCTCRFEESGDMRESKEVVSLGRQKGTGGGT